MDVMRGLPFLFYMGKLHVEKCVDRPFDLSPVLEAAEEKHSLRRRRPYDPVCRHGRRAKSRRGFRMFGRGRAVQLSHSMPPPSTKPRSS